MQILKSKTYLRMPWKNGGGETTEVARSPVGASLDAFDWRVSMAHVATAGPFSMFPEIDRSLAVIAGNGVVLAIGDRGAVRLGSDALPFAFPGDIPVEAALIEGAIDDLNVMTRRGRYRHLLSRVRVSSSIALSPLGETTIVIAMRHGARVHTSGRVEQLAVGDALMLSQGDTCGFEAIPRADSELFVVDLWRC